VELETSEADRDYLHLASDTEGVAIQHHRVRAVLRDFDKLVAENAGLRQQREGDIETIAAVINPEVFSTDHDTAHRAASPMTIDAARANVRKLATRVAAALRQRTTQGDAL
jgi:hypothetical protein